MISEMEPFWCLLKLYLAQGTDVMQINDLSM